MTPPTPARDTSEGRAYNDLRNLARHDQREPAEYFTLFGLEGFLTRLVASDHAQDFVLKGGVLMAAFAARRPTRDIDLAASGFINDISQVEQRVRTIIEQDLGDGLFFDPASVTGEPIRDEADYTGVRVKFTARLATAQIVLHVDVNFGDPIWPAPTEADLPLLLGETLTLRGYPEHMVLAEKIVTAIDRGEQNTRWRDFVDIAAIIHKHRVQYSDQRLAIETVANHRHVELEPLGPLLATMPEVAQRKWSTWRRKQRLQASTPEQFSDILTACRTFADSVLDSSAEGLTWDPSTLSWNSTEP